MVRQIRLHPGSDPNILGNIQPGLNISQCDISPELWIDINSVFSINFDHPIFHGVKKVLFYDFFHAPSRFSQHTIETVYKTSIRYPTVWLTTNAKQIPGIICYRYDYIWNVVKSAVLDSTPGWKQVSDYRSYLRSPIHYTPRIKKYLSLNRSITPYRKKLIEFLGSYDGYLSNVSSGKIISNEYVPDTVVIQGTMVPPSQVFFNNSYVSCQVESQHLGIDSVIFTEKTYEHLVRGRIVLNFGPRDFYQCLENDGWKLPQGVDLTWDCEKDDEKRFQGYLNCLTLIFEKTQTDIHDWFIGNQETIDHNYNMLENKPYDILQ